MIKLWSKRSNPAIGTHWRLERDCTDETVAAWFKIYSEDEPNVIFVTSKRKPPKP